MAQRQRISHKDLKTAGNPGEAELRHHTLFEQSPDGILILDTDGRILEFNEAAHRELGYSREEFAGLRISDIDPFETPEEIRARIRDVIDRGKAQFEVRHMAKNGEIRDVQVITQTIVLSGRNVFHTIWRDITKRKQSETALRESEERYRALAEAAQDIIFIIDRDDRIQYINRFGAMLLGQLPENITGKPRKEIFSPDLSEQQKYNLQEVFTSGHPRYVESKALFSGREIWLSTSLTPIRNQEGSVYAVLGISRNITEHRRADEELKVSRRFLETIIETEPECVKLIGRDGHLLMMNRSGLNMIEADTFEQVKEQPIFPLISPKYLKAFKKLTDDVFQGKTGDMVFQMTTLKGRNLWLDSRAVPLRNDRNEIIAMLAITRDITERRKLEEQLRQAQKMEAVGTFAGGIAHDFNNILTAIIGYASILQMKLAENNPLRMNVEHILTSAERGAQLTQRLLAFSRKQIINPKLVDLREIIRKMEHLLIRIMGENIALRTIPADEALMVTVDTGQMEQVLMNLATNARDSMPDGGTLTIETVSTELDEGYAMTHGYGKPGRYAVITVSDTGTGMAEETRVRIFEPFFTTKEIGKGTGLGLSIAYGIMKQHDGYINVYSEPGKGTTFKLYLPQTRSEIKTAHVQESIPFLSGIETILLAEDDSGVRNLTRKVLEESGYTVIEAVDGEDAVSKVTEHKERIQLVILDVVMPKKNGKEVYEEIKKTAPGIRVLFTSGYTANTMQTREFLDKGLHFIPKPVSPKQLLQKVREVLDE
ncbi:MAG TPA: PAS domain S-box protein [Thermodesulfovibrionales bacterium]|nr:PAS domain S-box protein [Thermodesulfovibrionales bacterium]